MANMVNATFAYLFTPYIYSSVFTTNLQGANLCKSSAEE